MSSLRSEKTSGISCLIIFHLIFWTVSDWDISGAQWSSLQSFRFCPVSTRIQGGFPLIFLIMSSLPSEKRSYQINKYACFKLSFPGGWVGKNVPVMQEVRVQSLSQEDPLEKEMETHYSILAQRIPWTEEPDGLQSMGSQRIRHDWVINTFTPIRMVIIKKVKDSKCCWECRKWENLNTRWKCTITQPL